MKRAYRVAKWPVASDKGDDRRRERSLRCPHLTGNFPADRRGGAALIVVLSLLGTLAFLGLLSYRFADQELSTAQNYALEPTATPTISGIPEFGLRQLIVGTPPSLEDSALYGSNYALVPNMIGRPNADERLSLADGAGTYADVNPFDGLGIGVWANNASLATGGFIFDYDGDGLADADETDFILNFSGAANPSGTPAAMTAFHPDAGYTYPDANSMFLAFDGYVRDPNNPGNIYRVIIPSFHRPQYFPAKRGTDTGGADANLFGDIYEDPTTVNKLLRPHWDHVNADNNTSARFLTAATSAASGDTSRTIQPFPFRVNINADGNDNQAGVWSFPNAAADPTDPSSTIYEYDVDCDGDGFRDAIWMDLDYPIVTLPDGRQFVPLYAFKVVDMDALLNVNAHGNMNGVLTRLWDGSVPSPGDPTTDYASSSNLGLSTSEVNLGLALDVDPVPAEQTQHDSNFGSSPTLPSQVKHLSNLELLMLLNGRDNYSGASINSRLEGRWGDDFMISNFYAWVRSGGVFPGAPSPGGVGVDDDADSNYLGYDLSFGLSNPATMRVPGYPATVTSDDDELAPVGHAGGGSAYRDPDLNNIWVPPFVHPLDYGGIGAVSYLEQIGGPGDKFTRRMGTLASASNPSRWPSYIHPSLTDTDWQYQYTGWIAGAPVVGSTDLVTNPFVPDGAGGYRSLYGVLPYWQSLNASNELHRQNELNDFLLDDGNEVILDRRFRNPEYDAIFPTSEMDGLALSETDFTNLGISNQLRSLGIVNLDKGDADQVELVRKRLTTDSWDRLDFGHGHTVSATETRAWEFTTWNGGGTFSEFVAGDGTFPPEFAAAPAGSATDPLRPEVRMLLKSELGYNFFLNPNASDPRHPRHRLNINRILSDDDPAPDVSVPFDRNTAFDADGNPRFRNLTPHPDLMALNLANTAVWGTGTLTIPQLIHRHNDPIPVGAPFTSLGLDISTATGSDVNRQSVAIAQEWWARYDRQRLARDIYTLLWILGGGNDTTNYTNTALAYTDEQVREMAQFAVNYVDALDRDDVITRFEYDKDLTDGWDNSLTPYEFVTGVEGQQLTISEVLWVQTADTGTDESASIWDDNEIREFMYIELRNVSPFPVELRDETFRVARYHDDDNDPMTDDVVAASFVFKTDPATPVTIGPGQTFLVGCHDNSAIVNISGAPEIRASDFYVNDGMGTEFDQIVPYRIDGTDAGEQALPTATSEHPVTTLDLDLSYTDSVGTTDHQNRFTFDNIAPVNPGPPMQNGNTLVSTETSWSSIVTCDLRLERRQHLRTGGVIDGTSDNWANNWIEVDTFEDVTRRAFDASQTLSTELGNLQSYERVEPLDRANATAHAVDTGTPPHSHTLGNPDFTVDNINNDGNSVDRNQGNSTSAASFAIWQPHFDRDLSSVFELLSIPMFGPEDVTLKLIDANSGSPKTLSGWYISPLDDSANAEPSVAMVRFMHPFLDLDDNGVRDYDVNGSGAIDSNDDNRWYRLFEFLTVPTGGDQAIRERLELVARTPGKINLNTIRDEAVLAAILDDESINRFENTAFQKTDDITTDGTGRNWYRELTLARDGVDPLNALNSGPILPLPGVPGVPSDPSTGDIQFGAIPFRNQGYVPPNVSVWTAGQQNNKTAHSLLRSHVQDDATFTTRAGSLERLGLFEARPTGDLPNNEVDYHTRNRLLAKLANHTTNRSNVFAVWMTVKYFEAHQPDATNQPNVVQIGGELADSPTLRRFYVVDRTLLEDAVQVDDNGTPGNPNDDIMTLNWRSFVVHQRTLPSN